MTYNANGKLKTTTVVGNVYTGLYAPDGSFNIVVNASGTYQGLYHPCGALNAFATVDASAPYNAANGSVNVIDTGGAVFVLARP